MTRAPDPTEVRARAARVLDSVAKNDGWHSAEKRFHPNDIHLIEDAMLAFASATEAPPVAGNGWVYFNPDSGEEYARNHPVESGECVDAQDIRPSTGMEDALNDRVQEYFQASLSPTQAPPVAGMGEGIPAGMKPWHGGDSAPDDWDPLGPVLLADGQQLEPGEDPLDWSHHGGEFGCLECWCIVAYTPKAFCGKCGGSGIGEWIGANAFEPCDCISRDQLAALTKPTPPACVSGEFVVVPRHPTPEAWLIREIRGDKASVMCGQMFKSEKAARAAALRLTNGWRLCQAFPVASCFNLAAAPKAATPSADAAPAELTEFASLMVDEVIATTREQLKRGEGLSVGDQLHMLDQLILERRRIQAATPSAVGGVDRMREALESALRALDSDSTPIIRRLARIQIRAALKGEEGQS